MLQAVKEAAGARGFTVRGFAPSASAARVLQEHAGIPSETLSKHLLDVAKDSKAWQAEREIWVVDESSMIGTKQAQALLNAADHQKARVVLVGDRQQLPSIEAGRPFAMLLDRGMPSVEMREIKRQKDATLKAAVMHSVERHEALALKKLESHTHIIPDRKARISAVVEEYLSRPKLERAHTLIVTGVNEDRREINEQIRGRLRQEKVLNGPEAQGAVLVQRDVTRAEMKQVKTYTVGDIVRFGRAYSKLGVQPGDYLTVCEVDIERGQVALSSEGKRLAWEPRRAANVEVYQAEQRSLMAGDQLRWTRNDRELDRRNGEMCHVVAVDVQLRTALVRNSGVSALLKLDTERHWEHAHASTVHAAQGRTANRVLLHLDSKHEKTIGSESFYVAISRAREEAKLYANSESKLATFVVQSMQRQYAIEAIERGPPRST